MVPFEGWHSNKNPTLWLYPGRAFQLLGEKHPGHLDGEDDELDFYTQKGSHPRIENGWFVSVSCQSFPQVTRKHPIPWWNALPSLKLTFSPLKIDGWKMILSFWVSAYFQGQTVSFRECKRHFFWCQMGWHHQLCSNLPIPRRDRQTLKVQYTLAVTRHVTPLFQIHLID